MIHQAVISNAVVGTLSGLKLHAVRLALSRHGAVFNDSAVEGVDVKTTVSQQPFGWSEIKKGAIQRAQRAWSTYPVPAERSILRRPRAHRKSLFDLSVGIESGIVLVGATHYDVCAVAVLFNIESRQPTQSVAYSALFPVPDWAVTEARMQGSDLGIVAQRLAEKGDKDPHLHFSQGVIQRTSLITDAVSAALCPIVHDEKYTK